MPSAAHAATTASVTRPENRLSELSSTGHQDCRCTNVFVERLWKSIKYEEVYLRAYETVSHARKSIGRYLDFYNGRRPHSSLGRKTPDHASFNQPLLAAA